MRTHVAKEAEAVPEKSREPFLIEQLALSRYDRRWERTHFAIYPSQQLFLRALQNGPVVKTNAEKYYAEVQANTPLLKDVPFGVWLQFLVAESLVTLTVEGYALSVAGQEFLMWKLRHMIPDKA